MILTCMQSCNDFPLLSVLLSLSWIFHCPHSPVEFCSCLLPSSSSPLLLCCWMWGGGFGNDLFESPRKKKKKLIIPDVKSPTTDNVCKKYRSDLGKTTLTALHVSREESVGDTSQKDQFRETAHKEVGGQILHSTQERKQETGKQDRKVSNYIIPPPLLPSSSLHTHSHTLVFSCTFPSHPILCTCNSTKKQKSRRATGNHGNGSLLEMHSGESQRRGKKKMGAIPPTTRREGATFITMTRAELRANLDDWAANTTSEFKITTSVCWCESKTWRGHKSWRLRNNSWNKRQIHTTVICNSLG